MIKTEYMHICNARADTARNQKRAYDYSLSVQVDREIKRERRREVLKELIISSICIITLVFMLNAFINYANKSYANTSDTSTKACIVTEVSENLITVSNNGNYYSFYGNGYEVGDMVVCQFTSEMEMEIIDVIE